MKYGISPEFGEPLGPQIHAQAVAAFLHKAQFDNRHIMSDWRRHYVEEASVCYCERCGLLLYADGSGDALLYACGQKPKSGFLGLF